MRRSALLALTLGCASCLRTPCEQDGLCLNTTLVALRPFDGALGSADIGDFDGDGRDELLFGPDDPRLVWLGVAGASTRAVDLDPALFFELVELRAADIDGDGMHDLLVTRGFDPPTLQVLRSRGDGSFEAPRPWPLAPNNGYRGLDSLGIGDVDVDGDGEVDLVMFANPGTLLIGHGDGEGGMRAASQESHDIGIIFTGGFATRSVRGAPLVDDLDGDGRAEVALLVTEYGQPDRLQVIRPGSAGEATPPWSLDDVTSSQAVVRMQLTADTPAWAVVGHQGVIIVTADGGT
ncbi:MAG: VCBS repeat-containing protein [Nannocystis sp.]|nr:VCBS repeat-containing protein [Nannocystis sp.]MBA3548775.1 VCBS repeat-containing protein [Nannocystis sp.]